MANEFVVRNGLIAQANSEITGSLRVTGGITGSLSGTSSYAENSNLLDGLNSTQFTLTSSFNSYTSSLNAFSASIFSYTSSLSAKTASFATTSSLNTLSSSFNSYTQSLNAFSASIFSYTQSLSAKTASFATTGSNTFIGTQVMSNAGNYQAAISGTSATAYTQLYFDAGRDYGIGVGNASETTYGVANKFFLFDHAAVAMRLVIDENGNVALGNGKTSPNAKLDVDGSTIISGSLRVTQPITGSLFGTASFATSASYALSASHADLLDGLSAAAFVLNSQTSSMTVLSASFANTASYSSYAFIAENAVYANAAGYADVAGTADTASYADNFTVGGTLTAQTIIVQTVTSSIVFSSGSNIFGNSLSNTQRFTGSVTVSGSLAVNGSSVILSNQTSSMSASYTVNSTSASFAISASEANFLDGIDATRFATTSSLNTLSSSFNSYTGSLNAFSASIFSYTQSLSAKTASFATTSSLNTLSSSFNSYTSSLNSFSASIFSYTQSLSAKTASFATTGSNQFNGNQIITGSLTVSQPITGSLFGTASFATSASNADLLDGTHLAQLATTGSNTFNGTQIITSSLTVGASSLGPYENTITLGARDNTAEGGQIGFNAPGGTYTSASFIDNWQNFARILRGTNASSTGLVAQWNLHTLQMELPGYTSVSSYVGTAAANLAVDSSGKVITVSTTGGSVFPYTGDAVITGSLTVTQPIYVPINGNMYFQGGDDAALYDVNITNTMGIYGVQDVTVGAVKLGSNGPVLYGSGSKLGIGTTTPTSASLTVNGNIWATSLTGSLLGTSSFATSASYALSSSYAVTASNADLLDGAHLAQLTTTSSFNTLSGSFNSYTSSLNAFSASIFSYTSSLSAKTASFANTGSNRFNGNQIITGSLTVFSGSAVDFEVTDTGTKIGTSLSDNHTVTGSLLVTGSITTTGTLTAQTLVVQTVTSSIIYSSGSNRFGNDITNVQSFTGSIRVTGSGNHYILGGNFGIDTTNPLSKVQINYTSAPSFNGNGGANILTLVRVSGSGATGTYGAGLVFSQPYFTDDTTIAVGGIYGVKTATNGVFGGGLAFYAQPAGASDMFEVMRYTDSGNIGINKTSPSVKLDISGSTIITGSLTVTEPITGSLFGTASYATTASYALTAQTLLGSVTSASYAVSASHADLLDGAHLLQLATTGSNNFIGNQTITGSLLVSSSSPTYFLGDKVLINSTFTGSAPNAIFQITGDQYINGRIGIGNTNAASRLYIANDITGSTTAHGVLVASNIDTGVTTNAIMFRSNPINTSGNLTAVTHFLASKNAFLAPVTNQYGFIVDSTLSGASNNYAFYGAVASTTSSWNLYMAGSANNYLAGNTGIGSNKTSPNGALDVFGNTIVTGSLIVSGTSATIISSSGGTIIATGVLSVGSNIQTSGTSFGAIPTLIVGTSGSGVLDLRNNHTTVLGGETMGILQFSSKDDGGSGYVSAKIDAITTNAVGGGSSGGGNIRLFTSPGGTGVGTFERIRIDGTGNVGINKTSPTATLDVSGSTIFTGSFTVTGSVIITGSVQGNVFGLPIASNTASLNLNNGNFFRIQLTGSTNTFLNPSNIKPGQTVNIIVSTTGSGNLRFPSTIKQASGSAYTASTVVGTDIITLISFDTTNLYLASIKTMI